MTDLVCFLEEPSAKEMLQAVLPKFLPPEIHTFFFIFEGKQDLEKQLVKKMSGWQKPDSFFLVLRDQDSGDCIQIKNQLITKAAAAKKENKTIIRIACHELESFYLGDLLAVEKGLSIKDISKNQNKKKFRQPDKIANASEELSKLTNKKYQKMAGSRAIAPNLRLDGSNYSKSFNHLVSGLKKLLK